MVNLQATKSNRQNLNWKFVSFILWADHRCRRVFAVGDWTSWWVLTTHTHTQPFNGLWCGTTRVGQYHRKHSLTHTHPDHRTSSIIFLHLQRSMASTLFILCAWQSSRTTSPGPLWSSSWSWTLNFILLTFLHPIIIFSQHMPIPTQPVLLQYQCYVIYTYSLSLT